MQNKIILGCALFFLSTTNVCAQDESFHDADPRNSDWRGGIAASHDGEIKLVAGGGFTNLTGRNTQTNMLLEYYTDSNNARFRSIHFDERFGGLYIDLIHTEEVSNTYTAGYMLPLKTESGLMFFPSVNYSYVDWDSKSLGNNLESACYSYADLEQGRCNSLKSFGGQNAVNAYLKDDTAHLASVSIYAVKPWNETHYTVLQANSGSSFEGTDMNVLNLFLLQGIRTHLGENILNIYLELKYDVVEVQGSQYNPVTQQGDVKSEETTASVGFDFRF
ncbi:hypothetical protein PTW35_20010 (plasmid) [Photobacterium sp. DA100]|uniref:hypothetical protein n=1 Tax=Photobacterium sp. DA100 TaxID=3027472 RepID=UPI00247B0BBA|nr:hypothetical protein [Photobacterium sp. DA100]WEM45369.1 hypothetical protein PTW35_20010 [Photobacterium sp. DA100]